MVACGHWLVMMMSLLTAPSWCSTLTNAATTTTTTITTTTNGIGEAGVIANCLLSPTLHHTYGQN